ncbi:MAG: hypothetical protein QM765_34000 [Myxococcales bacterium]
MGLLLLALLSAVRVDSDTACPSAQEVSSRLELLLGPDSGPALHRATLHASESGLTLELRDARDVLLATRSLPPASCRELAQASAAVLAAWEAELQHRARPLSELAPRRHRPIDLSGRESTPTVLLQSAAPEPAGVAMSAELGALLAVSGGSPRPGLWLALAGDAPSRSWGLRLSFCAPAPFRLGLGPGQVEWFRPALGLGPRLRAYDGVVRIEASLDLLGGLLALRGLGFLQDQRASDLEWGARAGLRLAKAFPEVVVWAELSGTLYARRQKVEVLGPNLVAELPQASFALAVGASLLGR